MPGRCRHLGSQLCKGRRLWHGGVELKVGRYIEHGGYIEWGALKGALARRQRHLQQGGATSTPRSRDALDARA
eukprot:366474-Chlamydomonas_euryale.AAC.31